MLARINPPPRLPGEAPCFATAFSCCCLRPRGHRGLHVCNVCGFSWLRRKHRRKRRQT